MRNVKIKKAVSLILAVFMLVVLSVGCGQASVKTPQQTDDASKQPEANANGEKVTVNWLCARPGNGAIVTTIKELAEEYKKSVNPNFALNFEVTPDRPSYLQKLRTLASSNKLPDLFDTDPDPFCQQLVDKGMLTDMAAYLKEQGLYDKFYATALSYQQLPNGSMYTLPLEYHSEMFWYNKKMFADKGIQIPKTFDEFLAACKKLKDAGITPIAVSGVDKWPVLRYIAMVPFRMSGNDYIYALRSGKASLKDPEGQAVIKFVQDVGKYFQEGFATTDYTAALNLFLDQKAAIYLMGTWELPTFTGDKLPESMKNNIGYFYMPTMPNAKTGSNEYFVNSGIGMAANKNTFEKNTKDFITYVINNYADKYKFKQQMPPMKFEISDESKFSPIFVQVKKDMDNYGKQFTKLWDTALDPDTNSLIGDEIMLLAAGNISGDEFAKTIDDAIKVNAPKYFPSK